MKRFCLDFSIVLMALGVLLCLMAIPAGEISLVLVVPTMLCLVSAICLAYQESVRLEERALRAKQVARRRAVIAKRRAALTQANGMQVARGQAAKDGGLYVA